MSKVTSKNSLKDLTNAEMLSQIAKYNKENAQLSLKIFKLSKAEAEYTDKWGIVSFKGVKIQHKLSIEEIIEQLKSLNDIEFFEGNRCSMNYFDHLLTIYKTDFSRHLILTNKAAELYKTLQSIFEDPINELKLRELGITDTDFALINNDSLAIEKAAADNEQLNIYQLASKFRFLDIAKSMYILDLPNLPFLSFNKFAGKEIKIVSNHLEFPLTTLSQQVFIKKNTDDNSVKTLAVSIHDIGDNAWNSKIVDLEYNNIITYFDKVIAYGNGDSIISLKTAQELISNIQLEHQNLEFAMVIITKHGRPEGIEILEETINHFPDDLAKNTIYLLDSCFAGQYHNNWNKQAMLITTSAADESSYAIDTLWINEKFVEAIKITENPVDTILEYCANIIGSTAYVSGCIGDHVVHNQSVAELYNELYPTDILGDILPVTTNEVGCCTIL